MLLRTFTLVPWWPAGDRTAHLMWRLSHGELPTKAPQVLALHIGMNDLGLVQAMQPNDGEAPLLAEVPNILERWVCAGRQRGDVCFILCRGL